MVENPVRVKLPVNLTRTEKPARWERTLVGTEGSMVSK